MKKSEFPRWDMTNIYPSLDSDEFKEDWQRMQQMLKALEKLIDDNNINPDTTPEPTDPQEIGAVCAAFLEDFNSASILGVTISNYIESLVNTDTFNEDAKKALSAMQELWIALTHMENALFKGWVGSFGNLLPDIIESHPITREHAFYLTELAEQSKYMMSTAEEKLAGELSLNGKIAWFDLSEEVKSKLMWVVKNEQDKEIELPITAIMNLLDHPEEKMRRRGYEGATEAFTSVEYILAAALNGVKGTQLIEFAHRNREDALHDSLDKGRIDRETLDAMLEAVRNNLPMIRKFYRTKAKRLGKDTLPYWDLNALTAETTKKYSYEEAQNFILENFSDFSDELTDLARTAFDNNWIDVGPREGKVGGLYCTPIYGVEESRILLNYEENLNWAFYLAHELGHAFHNYCLRGKTRYHRRYPSTLGETASIMCETIVANAAIKQVKTEDEELAIIEASLNSSLELIVEVYQAYLFESEVFKRRANSKLSAKDFRNIEKRTLTDAFGEALDENYRFEFGWGSRPHFFIPDFTFYNYPYTFGLLLGIGLYAEYLERGKDFVPEYIEFLGSAGMGTAADLAAKFDMDLRDQAFWQRGLDVIVRRIERYSILSE